MNNLLYQFYKGSTIRGTCTNKKKVFRTNIRAEAHGSLSGNHRALNERLH